MRKVVIDRYGRWDESCCWQHERREEKEVPQETLDALEFIGFTYSALYNEYVLISSDKLKRMVVTVK